MSDKAPTQKLLWIKYLLLLTAFFCQACSTPRAIDRTFASKPKNIWADKATFSDEFNGRQNHEPAYCYSMPAICQNAYNGGGPCPSGVEPQLKDLNKCNWSILNYPTSSNSKKEFMTFSTPQNVQVYFDQQNNGYLRLLNSTSRNADTTNCGKEVTPGNPYAGGYTSDCPFYSAGLWSNPKPELGMKGNLTSYGRYEVRAKLSYEKGLWPALWLMTPFDWPEDGEIDIMEWWSDRPNRIGGSLHSGAETGPDGKRKHPFRTSHMSASDLGRPDDTFYNEFHTYSVEWLPWEIRYSVDGQNYSVITPNNREGMPIPSKGMFWILNNGVYETPKTKDRADPLSFNSTPMDIDWVRTYAACESDEDFCPGGGKYTSTPGSEVCTYTQKNEKNKSITFEQEPACADYRNLHAEYLKSLEGGGFKNQIIKVFPNPFRYTDRTLKIQFDLEQDANVRLNIISMTGQMVVQKNLDQGLEKGSHEFAWDGFSENGPELAAGVYLIQMMVQKAGDTEFQQAGHAAKVVYLK